MTLDFPDTPSQGDEFTSNGRTWRFDGSVWRILPVTIEGPPGVVIGDTPPTNTDLLWVDTTDTPPTGPIVPLGELTDVDTDGVVDGDILRYDDGTWESEAPTFVERAGDTMTGALVLPGNPTTSLQAATKQYADGKVAKSGDTMTGDLRIEAPNAEGLYVGSDSDQVTDTKSIKVESRGYAGILLDGDIDNVGGEPGGAFVLLRQDGGGIRARVSLINSNGDDGTGGSYSGTTGNRLLIGGDSGTGLQFGAGGAVRGQLNTNGNWEIFESGSLFFGSQTRQMVNLWSTAYGIGVQGNTQYFRSGKRFSWFTGGSHNNSENNPGGGTVRMTLDNGDLTLGNNFFLSGSIFLTAAATRDIRFGNERILRIGTARTVGILDVRDEIGGSNIPGLRSFSTRDRTTGAAANMVIDSFANISRSTSSMDYKTDIEDADPNYYRKVLDLRPIWFRSKDTIDEHYGWGYWGYGAEEVAEIDFRLVHWGTPTDLSAEEIEELESDPDAGSRLTKPEGVQYDRVVVLLQAVVRDQDKIIKDLEKRIAALEES